MAIEPRRVRVRQTTKVSEVDEPIELHADGLYYELKTGFILMFDQEREDGIVPTTLKYTTGRLALICKGPIEMNHSFIEGRLTQSLYKNPYMSMTMATTTERLEISDGRCRFHYELAMNDDLAGDYEVDVAWTFEGGETT
ncbi:hypothetical protein A6395_06455 [Exiguobacterium sp. SH31]|uniref:DUF1934 domain-containing protein n=1 Tax=unclassified Exiguobacterium TaxID=2644629 RepID=UPI0008BB3031|nr:MULTISPECIES: DUF1934 domain-containing protein [unclassified Exiguobacterium]OGX79511.1 hypothetical protein A6395_06455 [Exiguobacterium sp. SH31]TCI70501.1 DUF1934 domain-containing protein [Exiguobacterium sp. SH0S7]